MASKRDLPGVFRHTPSCLYDLLMEQVLKGSFAGPFSARARFKAHGSQQQPTIAEFNGACLTEEGIDNVCTSLEDEIAKKIGIAPRGYLRLIVFSKGRSNNPEIDQHSTLDLIGGDDENDGLKEATARAQLVEMLLENRALRAQNFDLVAKLVDAMQITATMGSNAQAKLVDLATIRTQVSTAEAAGQLHSAAGLLVLFFGLPLLRKAFEVPDSMSMGDVVQLMADRLRLAITGTKTTITLPDSTSEAKQHKVPPDVVQDAPEAQGDQEPTKQDKAAPNRSAREWIDMIEDADFRREVAQELKNRPWLALQIQAEMANA